MLAIQWFWQSEQVLVSDPEGRLGVPRLTLQGIGVEVPSGFECRIRQGRPSQGVGDSFPVLHAATVPLPADRADYGGGVVEKLTDSDVFISLVEFGPEAVGSNLYPVVDEIPSVSQEMFHPFQLQRRIRGQAGTQVFFTYQGRAFCLYVVLGSFGRRVALTGRATEIIRRLSIERT
jgi:hypothetical protein